MKRFLTVLLAALTALTLVFGLAACGEDNGADKQTGVRYTTDKNGGYVVYGYTAEEGVTELDIEAAVKAKSGDANAKVVKIKEGAFNGNSTLESVIVPGTVTEIAGGAFKNMKSLKKITLPFVGKNIKADAVINPSQGDKGKAVDSEKSFGYIFGTDEYEGGAKIAFDYGQDSNLTVYEPMTLRTVVINPAADYELPAYAFAGLTMVPEVTFDDKVVGIGESAFEGAASILTLKISESVIHVYKNAFKDYKGEKIEYAGSEAAWNDLVKDAALPTDYKTVSFAK